MNDSLAHSFALPPDTPLSLVRLKSSAGFLECPACQQRRYIEQPFVAALGTAQAMAGVEKVFPRHIPCNIAMILVAFPENVPDPLTPDDLDRIFFRAHNEQGVEVRVDAKSATDAQFAAWAASHIAITGDQDLPWSAVERADFCDRLWLAGEIHLLK